MTWSRRYRARLRAAIRAALAAWREAADDQERGYQRLRWESLVTDEVLRDAAVPIDIWIAQDAYTRVLAAVREKRRDLGVV